MGFLDRLSGWMGIASGEAMHNQPAGGRPVGVAAYTVHDLNDPMLADFLRDGRISSAGVAVNERMSLRNSTFFRAMSLISGSMGMLPIHLMKRVGNGETEKAREHPLFNVLHKRPNDYQTPFEFKSYMQCCALMDGNAYAMKIRGARGQIKQLVPLKRRSITPKLSDSFEMIFEYRRPSGGTVKLSPDDVFHFRHPVSCDGIKGLSLMDVAVDALGLAVQAERAASRLFKGGVMSGGALETDQTLGEEAIANLKDSLQDNYAGAEAAGDWMILEEGMKAKPFVASAKDAQHLETRAHQAEEISRFTGVPRPLLMFDETSWGSGIEQLGRFFVTYCLMPWFVAWEEAIWRSCLTEDEQETYFAKFNAGALLRGSLKEQGEFFARALGAGGSQAWMTANEVRENFDTNGKPGGDDLPTRQASAAPASEPNAPDPAPPRKKEK